MSGKHFKESPLKGKLRPLPKPLDRLSQSAPLKGMFVDKAGVTHVHSRFSKRHAVTTIESVPEPA